MRGVTTLPDVHRDRRDRDRDRDDGRDGRDGREKRKQRDRSEDGDGDARPHKRRSVSEAAEPR